MSVPDQETANFYEANGITTTFPYGFYLLNADDLTVSIDGVVLLNGYTVTGVGSKTGGSVIFSTAPGDGVNVLLERQVALERATDYQPNGDLRSDVLNTDFDRIWMVLQDKRRENIRSLRYPNFENFDGLLPNAATRALHVLGFAENGIHTMLPMPASFGAGDMRYESFTAGIHFTPGVTTSLTLARDPGTLDNVEVFFDGIFQGTDQWGVTGSALNFVSPIPVGINKVFVRTGTTLSVNVPPPRSVGDVELSWGTVLNRGVDSIDELRTLQKVYFRRAFVWGYYEPGDGGGGEYQLDLSDTTSADNGGTIIVAADGGRWKLRVFNEISAAQFGARQRGLSSDAAVDTAAIQKAIDAMWSIGAGGRVKLRRNPFLNATILVPPNITIEGDGDETYIQCTADLDFNTIFRTKSIPAYFGGKCRNVKFKGLNFEGGSISRGINAIDLGDAEYFEVSGVRFANLDSGIAYNKWISADRAARAADPVFGGQTYFGKVELCNFTTCKYGQIFFDTSNRNTWQNNSYFACTNAYWFADAMFLVAETNCSISENIEATHNAFEWDPAKVFNNTWINLAVDNPDVFLCTVKDPGRQTFVGLSLFPHNDGAKISFFSPFNDGSGKPLRSVIVGTNADNGGTYLNNRFQEPLDALGGLLTRVGGTLAINNTVAAGGTNTYSITVPGLVQGDPVSWSLANPFPDLIANCVAFGPNEARLYLKNPTGGGIAVNTVVSVAALKLSSN